MKKLGIIGGAGPLASALFYETLVYESYRLQRPLPEIVLLNYPFSRGLTPQEKEENGPVVRQELLHCLHAVKNSGATTAVVVCNTLHLELQKLLFPKNLQAISLPHLVLAEIRAQQKTRLLLLGTENTCNSPLYRKSGLTIFSPSKEGQKVVNEVIDRILEGSVSQADARKIDEVIHTFPEEIDGVILGCTDLPVLHHHVPLKTTKTIYDSVKIPAKTLMRYL